MIRSLLPLLYLSLTLILSSCFGSGGPSVEERRQQQLDKYREQLRTERQTQHVTDSLMQTLIPEINTAKSKGFEYEKTQYDDLGRFRPVGTDPSKNLGMNYIRSAVDDYGRTQLIAQYCGSKSFVVVQMRVQAGDGTSVTTKAIAPNGGTNYQYNLRGQNYQAVTFMHADRVQEGMSQDSLVIANSNSDNGALAFVAQHIDDTKLDAFLISDQGKEIPVHINKKTREGLAATYELGVVLREFTRLQQENKTAGLKIQYLEQMILRKELENAKD